MDNIKSENGKDDSTTEKFPSLSFFCARMVYYIIVNCIKNIEKTVIDSWECQCDYFSSCIKPNGIRDYCDLCTFSIKYSSEIEEKNFRIRDLIKTQISLINDFKKYKHLNIYVGDVKEKNIDFEKNGQFSEWSFYHYVFKGLFRLKPNDFKM